MCTVREMQFPSIKQGIIFEVLIYIPCIAGKFGGELNLVVGWFVSTTAKLKSAKFLTCIQIRMLIPYGTAKFKSDNIFARTDSRQSAEFNSRHIFQV